MALACGAFFGAKPHVVVVVRVPQPVMLHTAHELAVAISVQHTLSEVLKQKFGSNT